MTTTDRRERARHLAKVTRAAQGLPPTIEDPVVLDRIATLLRSALKDTADDQQVPA